MAMREVDAPDYGTGKFLKVADLFPEVGSEFTAIYLGDEENVNGYGQDYHFLQRNREEGILTAKGQLAHVLKKAQLVKGEKVTIRFADEKDVGKESPMRVFKVRVEDGPKALSTTQKPATKPAPKPAQPATSADDWNDGEPF